MYKIIKFLAIADWLSPIGVFFVSLYYDPTGRKSTSIFLDYDNIINSGLNGAYIKKQLRAHGIISWGYLIVGGTLSFCVYRYDELAAERIIRDLFKHRYLLPGFNKWGCVIVLCAFLALVFMLKDFI